MPRRLSRQAIKNKKHLETWYYLQSLMQGHEREQTTLACHLSKTGCVQKLRKPPRGARATMQKLRCLQPGLQRYPIWVLKIGQIAGSELLLACRATLNCFHMAAATLASISKIVTFGTDALTSISTVNGGRKACVVHFRIFSGRWA